MPESFFNGYVLDEYDEPEKYHYISENEGIRNIGKKLYIFRVEGSTDHLKKVK